MFSHSQTLLLKVIFIFIFIYLFIYLFIRFVYLCFMFIFLFFYLFISCFQGMEIPFETSDSYLDVKKKDIYIYIF
jgi:hypothetical protein